MSIQPDSRDSIRLLLKVVIAVVIVLIVLLIASVLVASVGTFKHR